MKFSDAKVKIWSTLPILSEEAEQNDANPKLLSTLTLHNGMLLVPVMSYG